MHHVNIFMLALHRQVLRIRIWMTDYDLALLKHREREVRAARTDFQTRRDQLQLQLSTLEGA